MMMPSTTSISTSVKPPERVSLRLHSAEVGLIIACSIFSVRPRANEDATVLLTGERSTGGREVGSQGVIFFRHGVRCAISVQIFARIGVAVVVRVFRAAGEILRGRALGIYADVGIDRRSIPMERVINTADVSS